MWPQLEPVVGARPVRCDRGGKLGPFGSTALRFLSESLANPGPRGKKARETGYLARRRQKCQTGLLESDIENNINHKISSIGMSEFLI